MKNTFNLFIVGKEKILGLPYVNKINYIPNSDNIELTSIINISEVYTLSYNGVKVYVDNILEGDNLSNKELFDIIKENYVNGIDLIQIDELDDNSVEVEIITSKYGKEKPENLLIIGGSK